MRKSSAATTTPLFARGSSSTLSVRRSLLHQAPPCRSTMSGNGPAPFGWYTRASSGLSPWRRYSTSRPSISWLMTGSSGRWFARRYLAPPPARGQAGSAREQQAGSTGAGQQRGRQPPPELRLAEDRRAEDDRDHRGHPA